MLGEPSVGLREAFSNLGAKPGRPGRRSTAAETTEIEPQEFDIKALKRRGFMNHGSTLDSGHVILGMFSYLSRSVQ